MGAQHSSLQPVVTDISQLARVDNPATLARSLTVLYEAGASTNALSASANCTLNKIHQLLRIGRGLTTTSLLFLQDGRLTLGHARALVAFAVDAQDKIARQCLDEGWSVREIERRRQQSQNAMTHELARPYGRLVQSVSLQWGQPCDVITSRVNPERGRLSLGFSSLSELESILRQLQRSPDAEAVAAVE